jgi:hypothetical protein
MHYMTLSALGLQGILPGRHGGLKVGLDDSFVPRIILLAKCRSIHDNRQAMAEFSVGALKKAMLV